MKKASVHFGYFVLSRVKNHRETPRLVARAVASERNCPPHVVKKITSTALNSKMWSSPYPNMRPEELMNESTPVSVAAKELRLTIANLVG